MKNNIIIYALLVLVVGGAGAYIYFKNIENKEKLVLMEMAKQEELANLEKIKQEELLALEATRQKELAELEMAKQEELKKVEAEKESLKAKNQNLVNEITDLTKAPDKSRLTLSQVSIGTEIVLDTTATNVTFFKFKAEASGGDVMLKSFVLLDGNGRFTDAGNLSLWVDTNGDGVVDKKPDQVVPKVHLSRLVIDQISGSGYRIPNGKSITFEVKGDTALLSENGTEDAVQFAFASNLNEFAVEAFSADTGVALKGIKYEFMYGSPAEYGCTTKGCEINVKSTNSFKVWITGAQ